MKSLNPKPLATKTDLKKTEKVLREEMLRVEERFENKLDGIDSRFEDVNKRFDHIDEKFDQLLTAVSNFAGRVESIETENEIGSDQIRKLDKRLTKLESAA